ncbi:hypothetical protein RB597_003043 [Gaeumannomyces tritici]
MPAAPTSHLNRAALAAALAVAVADATPPMGWNSYNTFGCSPSEEHIKTSARGLVDLGFRDLGYKTVTVDCGWNGRDRDAQGRLQWNETRFPSGGRALGDFVHGLGLRFGLYSGAGYLQCGSTDLPASLGFEEVDAASFAEWGGDSLKYDNCYATSRTVMVDSDSAEAKSPARFLKMGRLLKETGRDIAYWLCQWGIGENVPAWAAATGQSWRMSNDIYDSWRSIWRIVNQAVPHARHTRPGAYADLDMLVVGLGGLTLEEERFHFGMWSIMKSPLHIGAVVDQGRTRPASLDIMRNREVIALNQDPLSRAARLALRDTEGEWDVWVGDLSGGRKVVGVANWRNESQTVPLDLPFVGGVASAAAARDVWAAADLGAVAGTRQVALAAHELKLLVLDGIEGAPAPSSRDGGGGGGGGGLYYHPATAAALGGGAVLRSCAGSTHGCAPVGHKVGDVGERAMVRFGNVSVAAGGAKYVGVDFINYDYAFQTAWGWGHNTRNMTVSVNGGPARRWAFPLGGNDWFETGRLNIRLDGFRAGDNEVEFAGVAGSGFAPDLVGFEVYE